MVLPIPHQSSFLYTANWTPTLDSTLLHTLLRLKRKHGWDGTVFPRYFFVEAQHFIEEQHGYAFEWEELYDQFSFMELRYHTFNSILDVHGTNWNCDNNSITVIDSHLEPLLKVNPLSAAYYRWGEPAYNELTMIFGFKQIKEEKARTVIHISDSPASTHDGETQNVQVTRARRKLFEEDEIPWDMESTNEKVDHYYQVNSTGEFILKQKSVASSRPLPKPPLSFATPDGKSCASSSPPMWWRVQTK